MARPLLDPEFGSITKAEKSHFEREIHKLKVSGKIRKNIAKSKYILIRREIITAYRKGNNDNDK